LAVILDPGLLQADQGFIGPGLETLFRVESILASLLLKYGRIVILPSTAGIVDPPGVGNSTRASSRPGNHDD
jgi:hypothetical protein